MELMELEPIATAHPMNTMKRLLETLPGGSYPYIKVRTL